MLSSVALYKYSIKVQIISSKSICKNYNRKACYVNLKIMPSLFFNSLQHENSIYFLNILLGIHLLKCLFKIYFLIAATAKHYHNNVNAQMF